MPAAPRPAKIVRPGAVVDARKLRAGRKGRCEQYHSNPADTVFHGVGTELHGKQGCQIVVRQFEFEYDVLPASVMPFGLTPHRNSRRCITAPRNTVPTSRNSVSAGLLCRRHHATFCDSAKLWSSINLCQRSLRRSELSYKYTRIG